MGHQTPGRPVDPDPTGGYYQPVRLLSAVDGEENVTLEQTRLSCGLAGASPDRLAAYQSRHRANVNPQVDSLEVVRRTAPRDGRPGRDEPDRPQRAAHVEGELGRVPAVDKCGDGICGPDETMHGVPRRLQDTRRVHGGGAIRPSQISRRRPSSFSAKP